MRISRKGVGLATLFAGALIAAGLVTTYLRPDPPESHWERASRRSIELLAAKDYEGLRSLEAQVFASAPDRTDGRFYATVALNCAFGRRDSGRADPYVLLDLGDKALRGAEPAGDSDLHVGLARELARLGLVRRAMELLQSSNAPPSASARTLAADIERALSRFGGEHSAGPPPHDPIFLRLHDLLTAPPVNPWYELFEDSTAPRADAPHGIDPDAGQDRDDAPSGPGRLLLALFDGSAPLAPRTPEDRFVDDPDFEPEDLRDLSHDPRALEGALALAALLGERGDLTIAELQETPPVVALKSALSLATGGGELELEAFVSAGGVFAWGFDAPGVLDFKVVVLAGPPGGARLWIAEGFFRPALELVDATADGDVELLISERQGSGGFLTASLFALDSGKVLWGGEEPLFRGNAELLDLDADRALEIVVREGGRQPTVDCGQCPALYNTTLYDLDEAAGRYMPRAARETRAELMAGTGAGLSGIQPQQLPGFFDASVADDLRALADADLSQDAGERRALALQRLDQYAEALVTANAHVQAAQLRHAMSRGLAEASASADLLDVRLRVHLGAVQAYLSGNAVDLARRLADEEWFVANLAPSVLHNLHAAIDLTEGRLADAFGRLMTARAAAPEPMRIVEGNLAWYYRLIRDYRAAYDAALNAVDASVREQSTRELALNMVHAATAAAELGEMATALEWLHRSVRLARGHPYGSDVALMVAETASSIALRAGHPDFVLEALDETVPGVTAVTWRSVSGSVLSLYGEALHRMRDPSASSVLTAAARQAASTSPAAFIAANYSLSQIAEAAGDGESALRYARSAFLEISRGRGAISLESHKLSFLTDKKAVVGRLTALLIGRRRDPAEVLWVLEGWKLRTFLDFYPSSGSELPRLDPEQFASQLQRHLSADDLFIDFFIAGEGSFAIAATRGAVSVVPLAIRDVEAVALGERLRAQLDVRAEAARRDIRRDRVPEQLRADLETAYRAVLAPVIGDSSPRRLLISSDESLAGLPWSALRVGGDAAVLDRFEVASVPSAELYIRLSESRRKAAGPARRALVVGAFDAVSREAVADVVGGSARTAIRAGLSPLGNGPEEVRRIGQVLSGYRVDYLLDSQAAGLAGVRAGGAPTKADVLRLMPDAEVVHIAAHGLFVADDPMRSALFLAGERGSGVLRARELASLDLANVGLVSLAACQTAMTTRVVGSEPFGFLRGLLGAGVKSVLLAEWEIDDAAAAGLFADIYAGLAAETAAGALRSAQLKLRSLRRHPYYWAGVSLHGLYR